MRARIDKTATVVCGPGSIVEITEDQFMALGDAAVRLPDVSNLDTDPQEEAPEEETPEEETPEEAPEKETQPSRAHRKGVKKG
ncbi:MAG: hypothetical protein HFF04_00815 [Oscillospiraceae bacterium]|nr:hypothetical protein [Oscillospiraceae bacterium]